MVNVLVIIILLMMMNLIFAASEMEYFKSLNSEAASFAVYTLYPPKYDQLALTLVGKKSSLALLPDWLV